MSEYLISPTETEDQQMRWVTFERPGYQGKRKDQDIERWNTEYGENNWRIAWELVNGEVLDYDNIFWRIYVPGYVKHFLFNPEDAVHLTQNYSYAYDKDMVARDEAFDPHALYNKPGRPNQFHNVALNIALEWYIGLPFQGQEPIQIREGKPNTPQAGWPAGWKWSPGRIEAVRTDLIRENDIAGWWEKGTIEDVYQTAKVLQVRE